MILCTQVLKSISSHCNISNNMLELINSKESSWLQYSFFVFMGIFVSF